ncbi:hypothetical protein SAMN05444411_109107 [Lutibacter oricola]|uniref:Uncharacterized protein n=1 Tax=Lutibacter oricola TaxID=762486 RepID=A0A1H3EJQ3_9FLAO|nr:hypothetical protein SAMN05444411_109107 [Lutibacter oricola]
MSKITDKNIPYSNMSFGTEPTRMVKFMRSCFIIQIFNFFKLNLKVMKIVVKGHS